MHFEPHEIYHVYNRGNKKQTIFFSHSNYIFFLRKIKKEWLPFCDILEYCLMPNHFHFIITPNILGCQTIMIGDKESYLQKLSKAIGKALSSYTKAINIERSTSGSLFQKKTKAKCLTQVIQLVRSHMAKEYLITTFHYIHDNPVAAGLVKEAGDWPYSSWNEYYGRGKNTLCNITLAKKLLGITEHDLKIHARNRRKTTIS
jgi:putative transposase